MSEISQIKQAAGLLGKNAQYCFNMNGNGFVCQKVVWLKLSLKEYVGLITKIHDENLFGWQIEKARLRPSDKLYSVCLKQTME